DVSENSYFVFLYYDDGGKPGQMVSGSNKLILGSDINPNGYTTIEYNDPIRVNGTFYVVLSGLSYSYAKIALASSNEIGICSVYGYARGEWILLSDIEEFDKEWKVAGNIVVHYTHLGDDFTYSIEDIQTDNNTIYPNPTNNNFVIKSDEIIHSVNIYDLQGRLIFELNEINNISIDIKSSDWTKGVYIVLVKTDSGTFRYKLMKT
ncbi:MAG: T9SS type A sorting domain-containing protein, partial [Marinilabiliaceae bacterium]|nr:T9SS type A sorting domain-containing protein [Marinilabiliaceae bacterium]